MTASGTAPKSLEFGLLGPFEVRRDGEALPLGGRRQRAILAMLACEAGHAVSVERLVDGVWGEPAPAGVVTSVQSYVFHLRHVLEPDRSRGAPPSVLVTVPGGYRLDVDPGAVDMTRFQELIAAGDAAAERREPQRALETYDSALAMWRGDVLTDLADLDFAAPLRARLAELRVSAVESRIQAELDLGHHAAVVAELGTLVAQHPLREGLHGQLMLALYRSGRQSDALAAYRDLRSVLDIELGIEPSPPLQELHNRILRQDSELGWTSPPGHGRSPELVPTMPIAVTAGVGEGGSRLRALALVTATVAVLASASAVPVTQAFTTGVSRQANVVTELDASGHVLAAVPVGTNPVALAAGGSALWVINAGDDTVSRINTSTHTVEQTVAVGPDPRDLVATGDDLWVTNFGNKTVSRINVLANRVVDTIHVGSDPDAIAAGPAGLWVANSGDNTIQRIDTTTGAAGHPVDVGDGPDGLAVDDTSVWVANGRGGSVMRIDAGSGDPMSSPIRVGSGPRGIVRQGDYVWVADELSQSVTRITVPTAHTESIDVGDGPSAVASLGRSVWVSEKYSGDVVRIDPGTDKKVRINIHAPVPAVAAVAGHIWVASGAFASTGDRGGTLRIAAVAIPGYSGNQLDPAWIYERTTANALRPVYDSLLAFAYSQADAQVLVPDLATSVPEPTDGGRTYTFNLRPGIRYSTGAEVVPSDITRGVERALQADRARPDWYTGIVGARACAGHPRSCDLSRGVITDDANRLVTFHLVAPDPQFLYKLAALVVPAPLGTRLGLLDTPLPGTGPYQVARYVPDESLTLTRNPYFRQWSVPAQPAGFADEITWIKVADAREAVNAVQNGTADLAEVTGAGDTDGATLGSIVKELQVSAPSRLHSNLRPGTDLGIINSSLPPFDDLQARQALNYAVDRRHVVQLLGGPTMARPTCQLIPPSIPGYQSYCPYTTGSPADRYRGPDLARGRKLVRSSGTFGTKVTVAEYAAGVPQPLPRYLVQVLRALGFRASLRRISGDYSPLVDVTNGFVEVNTFIADYPLPSNFYDAVVCHHPVFPTGYCNPRLDRRAAAATAALQTEPGAALRAWSRIDHEITDQAVYVPLSNPVSWWLTSKRVGNYQAGAQPVGPLLSQLWVR